VVTSDFATSDPRGSRTDPAGLPSPVQTASAASREKPPAKTARRRKTVRSSSARRSWLRRQRLLTLDAAASAREQTESVCEPVGDLLRRQVRHTRRRELDRERNAIQSAADLDDRRATVRTEREGRLHRFRALREEPHGFRAVGLRRIVGEFHRGR
jgi:hypothetical protein